MALLYTIQQQMLQILFLVQVLQVLHCQAILLKKEELKGLFS
jgi:hypothetical protein